MLQTSLLAGIAWAPEIRNILAVTVGVVVLVGSVYLLLMTNIGTRLGMLVAISCLFGWMTIMGVTWWIYGIGMKGTGAHWKVTEINTADIHAAQLDQARALPEPDELVTPESLLESVPGLAEEFQTETGEQRIPTLGEIVELHPDLIESENLTPADLGGWELLRASDKQRGDAIAAADAVLGPEGEAKFTAASDYKVIDAFSLGGKDKRPEGASLVERTKFKLLSMWHWRHPTHYALVQVQEVEHVEVPAGEAAPPPVADATKPVITVIMIRDLGDLRFPAFMTTLVSGVLFALTINMLHRRDKLTAAHRAAVPAGA